MVDLAIQAALDAGREILKVYAQDFEVELKADESPLTAADKASNAIIEKALAETPYPVLSEESREIPYLERKDWDTFWLVDPLDGTKEFVKKNGEFTVNIALIRNGAPVMGVVYAPVLDTLYVGSEAGAWKVEGCTCKSVEQLKTSAIHLKIGDQKAETKNLKVVASRSHCSDETISFIEQLQKKYGQAERVSRGSSLKLCMVAEGSADIYPRLAPTMEWDTAAAHAVVVAAGGQVFQYDPGVAAGQYMEGNAQLSALRYNKEKLLNPYFVVSILSK